MLAKLDATGEEIIAAAINKAIVEKDTALLSMFVKMLVPNPVPAEIGDDPMKAFEEGEIGASELRDIATAIEKIRNVEELEALRAKLDEIETTLKQR